MKYKIEEILTSSKESHTPVLLNFQNGTLNKNSLDSTYYFEALNTKTEEKSAILATRNGNFYNGIIEDSSNDLFNNLIAIKNKKTNKVRLIQIDQASMINQIYNDSATEAIQNSIDNTSSRALLIKSFGGRKAIISHERHERMKVNVDIVKEQLDKTIETSESNAVDDGNQNIDQNLQLIRPPFNKNATNICDIYEITNIIPKDLLDRLNDECYAILESDIDSIPIESEFLMNYIKKVHTSTNPKSVDNLLCLKICLYMDGLKNLIKTRQRRMDKIELSKVTEKIENHIRENFSDRNLKLKTKTKFSTDKALCYFITLALLISGNYETDINTLSKELSIAKQKLLKYALLVHSQLKSGTSIIHLQLPGKVKTNLVPRLRRSK